MNLLREKLVYLRIRLWVSLVDILYEHVLDALGSRVDLVDCYSWCEMIDSSDRIFE